MGGRRLILHVGPGRTGTSALQTMFCRQADALAAAGVHFPRWPGFANVANGGVAGGNGGAIAALIARKPLQTHYTADDGARELQALADQRAPIVLYSSEAMAVFDPVKLAAAATMAAEAHYITQAVYYLRDETAFANSVFARASASGKTDMPRERFLRKFKVPFARHLRALRETLGEANVIVRDYDFARDDLFGDFCASVLGIPRPRGAMPWLNTSAEQQSSFSRDVSAAESA